MKTKNIFFKKVKYVSLKTIFKSLGFKSLKINVNLNNIKDLENAGVRDISFFNSIKCSCHAHYRNDDRVN